MQRQESTTMVRSDETANLPMWVELRFSVGLATRTAILLIILGNCAVPSDPSPGSQSPNFALDQTTFASEESPSFLASFAPATASASGTADPVPQSSDANPLTEINLPEDSASRLINDDKEEEEWKLLPKGWNFHAQTTIIPEFAPGFQAKYSGPNSLSPEAQRSGTITADAFLGAPLWQGAEFHCDLLLWDGFGLSNTFGLNADPNGDAFKAGTESPRFQFSHFFIRQTIGLGGAQEDVPVGQFTLPGQRDISRLTITVGRMAMPDIFDNNTYNHDPHTQFMSWGGVMNLAWDFPADTTGFTTGIAVELNQPDWALRLGWFQMPKAPNGFTSDGRVFVWPLVEPDDGPTSDGDFWKEWGTALELERRWRIGDHPGAIRLQTWLELGVWASYNEATALLLKNPPPANTPQGVQITVPETAYGYHYKYGCGLNCEQELAKNVGVFSRLGWNDGQTAAATYEDVNWTAQLGVSVKGAGWHRPGDTWGLCGNIDGASTQQIAFLKAGGTGISDGDGNLSYTPEMTVETYYDIALAKSSHLAFDYQFFANPSFNADRGPVNVFEARLHWEY
jgi:high affinity Mn2+ porin